MVELHYIYHSCFAAVAEGCVVVYDYWRDPDERLQPLLRQAEGEGRAVYFVVSHFHEDHYNPEILQWCATRPQWHLLLSYDTVRRRRVDPSLPLAVLRFGERYDTPHFTLRAYHSTDVGVSTVTEFPDGTTLFHAGDCNNWYFPAPDGTSASDRVKTTPDQMEKLFLSILRDIRRDYPRLTHAMFPVDPRLGQEMLRGPLQLLHAIEVKHFHPMHYCGLQSLV